MAMVDKKTCGDAYERALKLLAIREHTRAELDRKLKEKGFCDPDVQQALDRLEKEKSLDEERFAEIFLRSRLKRNPEGKFLLAMRLEQRGCRRSAYQKILDSVFESGDYLPYLEAAVEKSLRTKGKEKTLSEFIRKGFRPSLVESLIDGCVTQG